MAISVLVDAPKLLQPGDARGISLYMRLAHIFRTQIQKGMWKAGAQLPTIPELARQFSVGTVTVRQAFQILASERLIESFRGRGTFVKTQTGVLATHSLRDVISDPLTRDPDLKIEILKRESADALPPELQGRHVADGPFERIRKIHSYCGVPFVLMDIYVASKVYRRFPKKADAKVTIPRLIAEYGKVNVVTSEVEMTVLFADEEIARALDYSPTAPLVKLRRWRSDKNDKLVMGSVNYFRADMFILDMDETHQPFRSSGIRPRI
jgi:GntR family transcriptional regulator